MEALQPRPAFAERDRAIVAVATVLLLIGMPIGWLTDNPSTGDVIAFIIALAINLAVMTALFLRFVPRQRTAGRAARNGMITGIVAAVLLLVFWTGLPFPVGAAAVALGLFARATPSQAEERGKATAAVALGGLAMLLSFVALLIG